MSGRAKFQLDDSSEPACRHSLVFCLDANDSAERLSALACDRCVDLGLDRLGGLVAEFFRGKMLNLLRGGLGRTSKNNPLQRNEKNPFHTVSPALRDHIMACRWQSCLLAGARVDPNERIGLKGSYDVAWDMVLLPARDQADGSFAPSRQISIANLLLALAAYNTSPGLSLSSPANPKGAA